MQPYTSKGSVKAKPEILSGWFICFSYKIRQVIYYLSATIVISSLSFIFLAILANVLLRYLFGQGLTWAYEIPQLLFPWSVAAGMALASTLKRNISVDSLINILPHKVKKFVLILVNIIVGLTCIGVVYFSIPIINAAKYTKLAETGLPQIYGYSSLIYVFTLICLISLLNIIDYVFSEESIKHNPENNNYS